MVPATYLLVAPSDATDTFGRMMTHAEIIRRLKQANSNLYAPENWHTWGANKTSLWIGVPLQPGSLKVCAFQLGAIPEWTQIGPDGMIISRGWRSILERCIQMRAARQDVLERLFHVTLGLSGRDGNCVKCRRQGKIVGATSAGNLCDMHSDMQKQSDRYDQLKQAASVLRAEMGR